MPGSVGHNAAAERVRARIAEACQRAGRDPGSVTLVAAVKTVDPERILSAGVADVGENRVQDMLAKQEALSDAGLRWHFIGALQRNKVRKVVGNVELIHSVDSIELLQAISRIATERTLAQRILIEVNLSGEPAKAGCDERALAELLARGRECEGVVIAGLMTVPADGPENEVRSTFHRLFELAADANLAELSMGMTGDFEIAIEEGATIVRIGTALFGAR
ncbi:MAG: YggS family pyridoxal phosphate-dependent enzyme [Actinomycetota bacterium]